MKCIVFFVFVILFIFFFVLLFVSFLCPTYSSAFILNESAVKIMGLQHPIGEKISKGKKTFTVIGVIKDIFFESPYKQVMPSIFYMNQDDGYVTVTLRLNPEMRVNKSLSEISTVFLKQNPSFPFEYKFV